MTDNIDNLDLLELHQRLILKHNISLAQRCINIDGDIEDYSYTKLDKQLKVLELQNEPITIYINSFGGCLLTQFAIIDRIHSSPCVINTIGTGVVMSAAIGILAAGEHRSVTKFTTLMHHGLRYNSPMSTIIEHDNELKHSKNLENRRFKFLASVTNKPYSWWSTIAKHHDYYFDAETALDIGLIHEIL